MKNIITFLFLVTFSTSVFCQTDQQASQNTSEDFFPEKLILASYNPFLNYSTSYSYINNMKYENTMGIDSKNIASKWFNAVPMVPLMSNPLIDEYAVELEMRQAIYYGIDGFKFKYLLKSTNAYREKFKNLLSTFVKVAEEKNLDFKFSINIVINRTKKDDSNVMMEKLGYELNQIFSATKFSKQWLRTKNDEVLLFTTKTTHVENTLMGNYKDQLNRNPQLIEKVKEKYQILQKEIITPTVVVFQVNNLDLNKNIPIVLKHFKAFSNARYLTKNHEKIEAFNALCKKENKIFIPKLYATQQYSDLSSTKDHRNLNQHENKGFGLENNLKELTTINTRFSTKLIEYLNRNVKENSTIIDIESWNNFQEGTHFSPELHHGLLYGLILRYYSKILKGESILSEDEFVGISFKNMLTDELNTNNTIKLASINISGTTETLDSLEVVSVLNEEGKLYLNGKYVQDVPKGINTIYLPKEEGKLAVLIKRKTSGNLTLSSPKRVTGMNEMLDIMTYCFTSKDERKKEEWFDFILEKEIAQMNKRFLLSTEKQLKWKEIARERYAKSEKAFYEKGNVPKDYYQLIEKSYDDYKKGIKSLLDDFQYQVWLELEENARKNKGIKKLVTEQKDILNGYNQLDPTKLR